MARTGRASWTKRRNVGPRVIQRVSTFRSPSCVWRGRGSKLIIEILKFLIFLLQEESLIGPHSVRVPSKTALACATCSLDIYSSNISHP